MNRFVKFLFRLSLGLFIFYLSSLGIIYFQQERIIFQRQRLAPDFHFTHQATEITIPSTDGVLLNALLFKPSDSISGAPKGLILYFHGNRHTLQQWGWNASALTRLGYDVIMIDYRGFGKSNGIPTEQGLYEDGEATLAWALMHYPTTPLYYYGRSLGSGVATYLATKRLPEKLILETPYDELKNVTPWFIRWLLDIVPLRHTFRNNERLSMISCPILILHGTADIIVPLSSALGLRPLLKSTDRFVIIQGGSHYNLNRYDETKKVVAQFLE